MRTWSRRQVVLGTGAIALLAGCGRLPGQGSAQVARVGFLAGRSADEAASDLDAFRQGLAEVNLIEGQNITLDIRYADGQLDRLGDLARELVGLPVVVLVAQGAAATRAAKDATTTTPIVMAQAGGDPVGAGLVASLAHPGGNVTGLSNLNAELSGKRLQLLTDVRPGLTRVGFVWTPSVPERAREVADTEAAARALGVSIHTLAVSGATDLDGVFEAALREDLGALVIQATVAINPLRTRIAEFALRSRLPTATQSRSHVVAGALMYYGPNGSDQLRRAATYLDKILKGASPADLPVEQPTTFEFVVNLKTAQALGLTIPHHVLLQATEVLQ